MAIWRAVNPCSNIQDGMKGFFMISVSKVVCAPVGGVVAFTVSGAVSVSSGALAGLAIMAIPVFHALLFMELVKRLRCLAIFASLGFQGLKLL